MLPVTEYTCGLTVVAVGCARPSVIVAVETIPLENSAKASAFIAIPLKFPTQLKRRPTWKTRRN